MLLWPLNVKEINYDTFCQLLGSNPGPFDPKSNVFTTTPQSHKVEAKFDCIMPLIASYKSFYASLASKQPPIASEVGLVHF